jgi:chromate transport protein ChrA
MTTDMTTTEPRLASSPPPVEARPSFGEAFKIWLKIGCITSAARPADRDDAPHAGRREKWVDEQRFLHALNFCMLLPGPEAQSSRPISVGSCMASAAGSWPASCSCCPARS